MNLSWIVSILALIGAEGQQPSPPTRPSLPVRVEFGIRKSTKNTRPPVCLVKAIGPRHAYELLETIYENPCPEGLVDERTIAAHRFPVEEVGGCEPRTTAKQATSSDASSRPSEKIPLPRTMDDPEAKDAWPMTLREAIYTALSRGEGARVLSPLPGKHRANGFAPEIRNDGYSGPIVIPRRDPDASCWRFEAEVMARVRSVEQQYWNLAQARAQLWTAERAVSLSKEVLEWEQTELLGCHGTVADLAEAAQRHE